MVCSPAEFLKAFQDRSQLLVLCLFRGRHSGEAEITALLKIYLRFYLRHLLDISLHPLIPLGAETIHGHIVFPKR